jgi:MerR family transcriptional regulator/heat shock protein HspR
MEKTYWTIDEVLESLQITKELLVDLEKEQIVCSTYVETEHTNVFTRDDVEKIRVIKTMVEDLGVNLPGVEVILHMRQEMIAMRKQFNQILDHIAREARQDLQQLVND